MVIARKKRDDPHEPAPTNRSFVLLIKIYNRLNSRCRIEDASRYRIEKDYYIYYYYFNSLLTYPSVWLFLAILSYHRLTGWHLLAFRQ